MRIEEYIFSSMVTEAHSQARWELYRLLAEPLRLRLMALASEEELAVGELAELLGEEQPNVSRHLSALKRGGIVRVRRHGTWTLVRFDQSLALSKDPVLTDALATGRGLCERDGSLGRVGEVLRAREKSGREFFSKPGRESGSAPGPPSELAAYLMALAPHLARRSLAVDAGAGDGRLLEALAPLFDRVVAADRSGAQLSLCAERVCARGFGNVQIVEGELDGRELRAALGAIGADVVLASRVLHHAPRPAKMVRLLAALAAQGGTVIVIDYERHEDESLRTQHADLWLGFEARELRGFASDAGLTDLQSMSIPGAWCGAGHDRHIPWQVVAGHKQ